MYKKQSLQNVIVEPVGRLTKNQTKRFDNLLSLLPLGFGSGKPVVAILRLEGVIGKIRSVKPGLTLHSLNKLINKIFKIDKLEAVCLAINSPGGSPVQAESITNRIIHLAKSKSVPVYSFIEDVAASGGYWLACAGNKIFASHCSIVGSIGVISSSFGLHKAIDKLGVERRVYTQGNNKSILDPFMPAKDSDVKIINKIQKNIHHHFIDSVKILRSGRLTQSDEILFNGEFWTGQTAKDYGLIDDIGDIYSFIQDHFGSEVRIENIEQKQSWLKQRFGLGTLSEQISSDITTEVLDVIDSRMHYSKFDLQ